MEFQKYDGMLKLFKNKKTTKWNNVDIRASFKEFTTTYLQQTHSFSFYTKLEKWTR